MDNKINLFKNQRNISQIEKLSKSSEKFTPYRTKI